VPVRYSLITLYLVNQLSRFLAASVMLDQVALDPYTFTRDAFLQRRQNDVYDGYPPEDSEPVAPDDGPLAK
jgi:phospholipid-binding lipoprotein MlaA